VNTLASENDRGAQSLPASSLVGDRIGIDLEARFLNSILKGRIVGRIGPLGDGRLSAISGQFKASIR
jgi:hypothetical protein